MVQNFISKTSTILNSIAKVIYKIYQLERVIAHIHSVMTKNYKNVPLIVCDFHVK